MKQFSIKALMAIAFSGIMVLSAACQKRKPDPSPPGYDLNNPVKHIMRNSLLEISGITFTSDSAGIYAIQDEEGILFHLDLENKTSRKIKFSGRGDYEDLAICNGRVIVMESNGDLFTFPLTANEASIEDLQPWKDEVPKAEYEGLFADTTTLKVYVLTKREKKSNKNGQTPVHVLQMSPDGSLDAVKTINISHSEIEKISGKKKVNFQPSGLAWNYLTKEWFIISSVNKMLVIADADFKIKSTYHLNGNTFNQPEGIAFDKNSNLYISNEGGDIHSGNILEFKRIKP